MRWLERREGWQAQGEDARDEADVDYSRIIHSASFRRLQGKTQILNLGDGDFYRTRLTHSLEVAQVANGIVQQFAKDQAGHRALEALPSRSMIQAAGAVHDLGHPPFGHGGEVALNYCMRDEGGFEGNGQTLRILGRLEKFSKDAGANLTRRTLLGVLKYPAPFSRLANAEISPRLAAGTTAVALLDRQACKPPKCFFDGESDLVEWILEPLGNADRDLFTPSSPATARTAGRFTILRLQHHGSRRRHRLRSARSRGRARAAPDRAGPISSGWCRRKAAPAFLDSLKAKYKDEFGNHVYGGFVQALFGEGGRRKRFHQPDGASFHHRLPDRHARRVRRAADPLSGRAALRLRGSSSTP
jgi:dGTPase